MDDLEITIACARASEVWKHAHKWYPTMTLDSTFSGVAIRNGHCYLIPNNPMRQDPQLYDPLHDDAQCFALVKRFRLDILDLRAEWTVRYNNDEDAQDWEMVQDADLNRAICLCVAQLPAAQQPEGKA